MTDVYRIARLTVMVAALAVVGAAAMPGVASAGAKTILVSKSSAGPKGDGPSDEPSISATGRYVAFDSQAGNLVPDDTNGTRDCFVRDLAAGTTERVSISAGGQEANAECFGPVISQSGRFVAFRSGATNLGGSTNGLWQIYLRDRRTGATTLVSQRVDGGDGGDGQSEDPAISGDGRFVVYQSVATNLVPGDTNNQLDVFLYDRVTGITQRVSSESNGGEANGASKDPAISANGRFIVFDSVATNLVKGDTNKRSDVFIHDRVSGKTTRVSVRSNGGQANGPSRNAVVSGTGRFVAYESRATNLVPADRSSDNDVFVYDRSKKRVTEISVNSAEQQARGGYSSDPTISNNGRWVAFESTAANLVKGDTNKRRDSFLRDRAKGTTIILSKRANGKIAAGEGDDPFISGNGRFVAFESTAPKMVAADNDTLEDIYRTGPLY